jgi:5'-nucleotidase
MDELRNYNRREVLRLLGASALAIGAANAFGVSPQARRAQTKISILHTNDWHSRIDPFPDNDPKFPSKGGAARRATLIKSIRKESEHVLLLDAGDIIQGTPYFNYYHGEPEIKLMNLMGYDAATMGNHDFDNGMEALARLMKLADFPFVNCNYELKGTPLENLVQRSIVVKRGGVKIGITGVGINLKGFIPDEHHAGVVYHNPIAKANEEALYLKKERSCSMVICLSHLGYSYPDSKVSDRVLASESENIDLILGGHTHTFLEKPEIFSNKANKNVVVNQVGWAGLRLGQINCVFSSQSNMESDDKVEIEVFKKSIAI